MKLNNWTIISGENGQIDDGQLIYEPEDEKGNPEMCYFKSDKYFNEGEISFKVKAETSCTSIGIQHKIRENGEIVNMKIGHAFKSEAFGFDIEGIGNKKGSLKHFDLNNELFFKIKVKGSKVRLLVNNIEIINSTANLLENQLTFFMRSKKRVKIHDVEVNSYKLKAFVVMQFSEEFNQLYKDVIAPICENKDIESIRADNIYSSTPILKDITENIKDSSLIIAEITPNNPNVFYEIGYAHAINKPTILLCERNSRDKLPFDLSGFRVIFYENTIAGKKRIENELERFLDNIFRNE
ncbi:TIR domain-containing protein [Halanaerobium kushneri]|uniref:Nucleoside 2-deoxyribosyltransferase n=1 Tax=Halanaerobium kushneri TaxID=56779 RepID=A0A1N6PGN7_9FIRM|nr:hypothetical protein [Halanaerobium kushneri]SIQ03525.1 hypothetical protein SAMN05421834_10185 [Halanaerobium kushneri]